MLNSDLIRLFPLLNVIIFVFFKFMFNLQSSQYLLSLSICFCSPSGVTERSIRSSAYISALIGTSLFRNISDSLFRFIIVKMSLTYKLKSIGLSGHPCRTPIVTAKNSVQDPPILTAHLVFLYMSIIKCNNLPCSLFLLILQNRPSCQTES